MGNSHASRKIFEKLDTNHKGTLSLQEFMNTPELSHQCSLCTLYFFDFGKDGTLNFKEFMEMEKFVQKVQKQIAAKRNQSEHVKHLIRRNSISGDDRDSSDDDSDGRDGNENDSGKLNRDRLSPPMASDAIVIKSNNGYGQFRIPDATKRGTTRNRSPSQSVASTLSPDSKPGFWSAVVGSPPLSRLKRSISSQFSLDSTPEEQNGGGGNVESASKQSEADDVAYEVTVRLLPSLHKELFNKRGRECFLAWLFKLSDMRKEGNVSLEELEYIMTAVKNDGIDLKSLAFDSDDDLSDEDIARQVMNEFDSTKTGYLIKEDFMRLGDLIISMYEARHTESETEKRIDDLMLTHVLGEGSYGIVKEGTFLSDGRKCAVKCMKLGTVRDRSMMDVEIQAMLLLKHQNVVRLFDVLEDDTHIYLVMELCGGGNLYQYIKDKPFDEELARYYFAQLIEGLSYCHENGVCHRDLRLENLLLDNDGMLKITDFGQARMFKKGWDIFSTQLVGSLYHLSPEQINGTVYSGEKIDIWSAGIILYSFLTSHLPFCSGDIAEMFEDIKAARYTYPNDVTVSDEAKDLVSRMIQVDPDKRITMEEIRNHPWMQGPKRAPRLSNHTTEFEISSISPSDSTNSIMLAIRTGVENILRSFDVHLNFSATHERSDSNGQVCPVSPTMDPNLDDVFLQELAEEGEDGDLLSQLKRMFTYKCIDPEHDLKFFMHLIFTDDNKLIIEFKLKEGATAKFQTFMNKLIKGVTRTMKRRLRRISVSSC